jgi:putative mRNA 3-end processing factor
MPQFPQPFESWLRPEAKGLYCLPGDFYIDPHQPVDRAVITHGHSDHARAGHQKVLATAETLSVMKLRLGAGAGVSHQIATLGEPLRMGDVEVTLVPAGHILGSAQVVIDYNGQRAVVSGDYKRRPDPTCAPFELVRCDLFITEATFALPVFKHEPDAQEIGKLLSSLIMFPDRTHQIGVYSLGKCQRLIKLLRIAGYDAPIWLHGSMKSMCDLFQNLGVSLSDLRLVSEATDSLAGQIVLCPPSAIGDRWSRRFADPIPAFASGWMRIRARARQQGVELPLIISDHADWPELLQTVKETEAQEIWITHGRDDALQIACANMGLKSRALALVGLEEEGE